MPVLCYFFSFSELRFIWIWYISMEQFSVGFCFRLFCLCTMTKKKHSFWWKPDTKYLNEFPFELLIYLLRSKPNALETLLMHCIFGWRRKLLHHLLVLLKLNYNLLFNAINEAFFLSFHFTSTHSIRRYQTKALPIKITTFKWCIPTRLIYIFDIKWSKTEKFTQRSAIILMGDNLKNENEKN